MGTANVGWPVSADDGEPAGPSASRPEETPASRTPAPRAAASPTSRERTPRGWRPGRPDDDRGRAARPAVSVLADRLAAALVHHEPGWRLPRHSALARRYNVSAAEIEAAVEELVGRHLVRRLADGQVYRASPAEYVVDLEGISGLATRLDAMGAEFSCRSRQLSWRLPPEDISWALRCPADQQVCVIRYLWTADGEPAALCTSYVPGDIATRADAGSAPGTPSVLSLYELAGVPGVISAGTTPDDASVSPPQMAAATALHLELQAPLPSVARSLRLGAGQPAMIVTIRFDDPDIGRPVALTIAVLRPEIFRLVLQTPPHPLPPPGAGNLPGSWAHAVEGWEP